MIFYICDLYGEIGGSIGQDSVSHFALWCLLDLGHWVGYGLRIPYLPQAIPITVAIICYVVAYLLCQPLKSSKLLTNSGIEHLRLVIPGEP